MVSIPLWWQAITAMEAAVTLACAALTGGFFVRAHLGQASPGRRTAALTLVAVAAGDAAQAVLLLTGHVDPWVAVGALPAALGQVLIALLVVRQIGGSRE